MEMTLEQIRREITLALMPVQQSLESLQQEQHDLAAEVWKQGVLLGRLDGRLDERLLLGRLDGHTPVPAHSAPDRLNGHAKTMGGAGMMAVVWALVEIIQTLIAAP